MALPKCFALDFDHTAAHFVGGFDGLVAIFTKYDVPEVVARVTLDEVNEKGFSLENYLQALQSVGHHFFGCAEDIEREFTHWLRRSLVFYDDTLPFVRACRAADVPIVLVTFGVSEYQRRKIGMVGMPHDELHVTTEKEKKAGVVGHLGIRYGWPVVFVDDDARELDYCRQYGIEPHLIQTFLMQRPDGPARNPPRHHHHIVTSLAEILPVQLRE